jgi:hypothetical protein
VEDKTFADLDLDTLACIDEWQRLALEQVDKWVAEGVGPLELRDNCIHCVGNFTGMMKGRNMITPAQEPAILGKLRAALNERLAERLPMHSRSLWQLGGAVPTMQ